MWGIADTVRTIVAACVLHNMCLSDGDNGVDMEDGQPADVDEAGVAGMMDNGPAAGEDAVAFRDHLMYLMLAGEHR